MQVLLQDESYSGLISQESDLYSFWVHLVATAQQTVTRRKRGNRLYVHRRLETDP